MTKRRSLQDMITKGHSLIEINHTAMRWADERGWNTPKAATMFEHSFENYDPEMIALLPVDAEIAEQGVCKMVKLVRDGTGETAYLYIFHRITMVYETSALVEITEEQFRKAHLY